jgi:hypothetical protein
MLLVGGLRAWCSLVVEAPLRKVIWNAESATATDEAIRAPRDDRIPRADGNRDGPKLDELDLDVESQWLESLHDDKFAFISTRTLIC